MQNSQTTIRSLLVAALVGGAFGAAAIQKTRRNDIAAEPPSEQHSMLAGPSPTDRPCSQIIFANPEGMTVTWDVTEPGKFDSDPLKVPGRYNFPNGAAYRLRLTDIPGHEGMVIYPTIEVAPPLPRTEAYLDKNAIPVSFTEADWDAILQGRFVTSVVYLPDSEDGLLAAETIVDRMLEPGVDPIVEADRRGAILAIVRLGNVPLQRPIWVPTSYFP